MFVRNISTDTKIVPCMINRAIVESTANTGTVVDMSGYQSVTFVLVNNTLNLANTPVLSAVQGINTTVLTAVPNSTVTVAANTNCQILEISRSKYRYVAPVVTGAGGTTANTPVSVIAILTAREPPVTNMVAASGSFNTTTGVFDSQAYTYSSSSANTSILLLPNV
jgi:hypothetical protein